MKLAIVTAFPPSKITLNEYAYHLVKQFVAHDDVTEVVIITDVTAKQAQIDFSTHGCKVTVEKGWEFNSYTNIFSILKNIRKYQPDGVLFNLQFMKFGDKKVPAALGLATPMLSKWMGFNTITLLHNILEEVDLEKAGFTKNPILRKIYTAFGTMLTKVLLQSNLVAVTIKKYVDVLTDKYQTSKVALVPHGSFEIPEQPSLELPSGPKKILTFGKFGSYKKVEILLEAAQIIQEQTKHKIEIVIAGTNNPNTPSYLEGVQQKFKHLTNVVFTGYVEEEDVATHFQNSAMVVFPYTSTTGSSGVLHQAGCYGKATVLPNLGDLELLIKDEGYTGAFFDPTSATSLAKAIQNILDDDAYRIALGQQNFKAASALPMSVIADTYMYYFNELHHHAADEIIKKSFAFS